METQITKNMESSNRMLTGFIQKENEAPAPSLGDLLKKYFYYWPLFLVCMVVSMSVASIYLRYSKPSFMVKAKVLVQLDGKGIPSESTLNKLLAGSPTGRTLEDEMEILKSREVASRMVYDLGLWQTYAKKGRVADVDLYGQSPVKVNFISKPNYEKLKSFEINILNDKYFTVIQPSGREAQFAFGQILQSGQGLWSVEKTADFNQSIGSTIKIGLEDPIVTVYNMTKKLQIDLANKNASVIDISIEESVFERGKDVLNTLIKEYNFVSQVEKNKVAASTIQFIDDRLRSLTGELTSVEKEVEGFRKSRGLTDISSESQLFLENVKNNDSRINEVEIQLSVIKGLEQYINTTNVQNETIPSTVGLSDPGLVSLVEKLIDLQLKYKQLMGTLPEKNPAFDPLRHQIASTRTAIRDNVRNMKLSLESTRNKLQSFNSRFEGAIRTIPTDERQLVSIKRQQGIKEGLYIYLLQKREEAAVSQASNLTESQVIDSAYLDSLKKPLTYSIAIIVGLLIPLFLLFLKELFNSKVTSVEQVERMKVPIACELVYEHSRTPLVVESKTRRAIGEQFRSLRTDLSYLHAGKKNGRVTLVTSSISGEGKSFISSNLAVTLAASGRKTVLLEFDMRKPKVRNIFKVAHGPGLSDFLNNKATISDIVHESELHPGLFIISTGSLPDNPSELLEKQELDQLFSKLREEFDDILVDTPPISLVTDAMLLSRIADASLYVVRQGVTYKKHLEFIRRIDYDQKLPNIRVVYNGVNPRADAAYGYQYYGSLEKTRKFSLYNLAHDLSKRLLISNT